MILLCKGTNLGFWDIRLVFIVAFLCQEWIFLDLFQLHFEQGVLDIKIWLLGG